MTEISQGTLLVAEPFMKDPNFQRSVVLMCEHDRSGSFGITINKLTKDVLGDYLPDFEHLQHPVGHHEAADQVDRRQHDRDQPDDERDARLGLAGHEDRPEQDDPVDRVGPRHEQIGRAHV